MKSLCEVSCTEPKKKVEHLTQVAIKMGKDIFGHYWIPQDAFPEVEEKLQITSKICD